MVKKGRWGMLQFPSQSWPTHLTLIWFFQFSCFRLLLTPAKPRGKVGNLQKNDTAMPFSPARPVRPMRWTYWSMSRGSWKFTTQRRSLMSGPRPGFIWQGGGMGLGKAGKGRRKTARQKKQNGNISPRVRYKGRGAGHPSLSRRGVGGTPLPNPAHRTLFHLCHANVSSKKIQKMFTAIWVGQGESEIPYHAFPQRRGGEG